MPVLTDFSEIKAEVRVPFDEIVEPAFEDAREASDPVGAKHCESIGKKAVYVSGRKEGDYAGSVVTGNAESGVTSVAIYKYEYVFLYRCEAGHLPDESY